MSRKQKKEKGIQPRGEVVRSTTPRAAYGKIGEPQVEIAAWCRDEKAELPPEQVHFILHWPVSMGMDMPPIVVRFKSPDTLGFIIEELIKYRRVVWPDSQPVSGEQAIQEGEGMMSYLDRSIRFWRGKKAAGDQVAEYYIDAFQSVRSSIFGELLPLDASEPPEDLGGAR